MYSIACVELIVFLHVGNDDRKIRLKKGKASQIGRASTSNNLHEDKSNRYTSVAVDRTSPSPQPAATPRSSHADKDTFNISNLDVVTSNVHTSPRRLSPHSTTQRLMLLVDTGSGRIAMTGEVAPEELYCNTALQGVLQDNEDVELVDSVQDVEEGIQLVNMTQSMLLCNED